MRGEKTEKEEENDRDEESSKRVGDLGWERGRSEKAGTRVFSQVDLHIWKKTKWKNAY